MSKNTKNRGSQAWCTPLLMFLMVHVCNNNNFNQMGTAINQSSKIEKIKQFQIIIKNTSKHPIEMKLSGNETSEC